MKLFFLIFILFIIIKFLKAKNINLLLQNENDLTNFMTEKNEQIEHKNLIILLTNKIINYRKEKNETIFLLNNIVYIELINNFFFTLNDMFFNIKEITFDYDHIFYQNSTKIYDNDLDYLDLFIRSLKEIKINEFNNDKTTSEILNIYLYIANFLKNNINNKLKNQQSNFKKRFFNLINHTSKYLPKNVKHLENQFELIHSKIFYYFSEKKPYLNFEKVKQFFYIIF